MSRYTQIFNWLSVQDGPRKTIEIAEGTGIPRSEVQGVMSNMVRDGRAERSGRGLYVAGNPAMPHETVVRLAAEARRRKAAEARARRAESGELPRWLAERNAKREAKRQARMQAKQDLETTMLAQRMKTAKVASLARRIESSRSATQAEARPVPLMTSEEWIARGNKVQRLKPFEVSPASRFKRIKPMAVAA